MEKKNTSNVKDHTNISLPKSVSPSGKFANGNCLDEAQDTELKKKNHKLHPRIQV